MKEGNLKKYELHANVGLIASGHTFEGPVVKDKGPFILSARRTYVGMFLGQSNDQDIRNTQLFFL